MSARKITYCVFILLSVSIVLFAAFVWPTAYRYFPMSDSEIKTTARINRFTGHAELLLTTGWVDLATKSDVFDQAAAEKTSADVVMKAHETPAGVGKKANVTQTMNSGGYTYVEVVDVKGQKAWLAFPEIKVSIGASIEYPETPPITNFQSKNLNKTFEKISFIPGIRIIK